MVVTNSFYTKAAVELAKANGVKLWNREDLVKALLSIKKDGPVNEYKEEVAAAKERSITITNEVCAVCGKPVTEKVKQYCLTNQQRFGGKIYCFDHQRNW